MGPEKSLVGVSGTLTVLPTMLEIYAVSRGGHPHSRGSSRNVHRTLSDRPR